MAGKTMARRITVLVTAIGAVAIVLIATGTIPLFGRAAASAPNSSQAKAAEGKEQRAVMVTVAPVALKQVKRTVDSVGSFQGFEEVTVAPKVGGRVVKIHHDKQDIVHKGDVLLEIDPTDYQLAVNEARKALDAELAKAGLTALPPETTDVQTLLQRLPTYRRAVNVEENARRKLDRANSLRRSNALSQEDVEQIATDYEVAKATRQQVQIDVETTVATARQKQALLATAQQHLTDTRVEVPAPKEAAGVDPKKVEYAVAEKLVSEGEMVMASMIISNGVFKLVICKTLKLVAPIPERFSSQVRLDQDVEIRAESYPDRIFTGKVRRISPTVDRLSRTFQVEIHVPNEDNALKPGGFAKLAIITQSDAKAQAVPVEALVSFAGVNKVFVIRDDKAHAIEVAPGVEGKDSDGSRWIEVETKTAGELKPAVEVITSGHSQLAEDVPVQVRTGGK